jgi:chromosome segregation ATPase
MVVGFSIAICFVVVLAASVAKIGIELDQLRLERSDLQTQIDGLNRQIDRVNSQRRTLLGQLDEHVRTIEQLKHEMGRARNVRTAVVVPDAEIVARKQSTD